MDIDTVLVGIVVVVAAWALLERSGRRAALRVRDAAEARELVALCERDAERREHQKTAAALVRTQQQHAAGEARWTTVACAVCRTVAAPHRVTVSN